VKALYVDFEELWDKSIVQEEATVKIYDQIKSLETKIN